MNAPPKVSVSIYDRSSGHAVEPVPKSPSFVRANDGRVSFAFRVNLSSWLPEGRSLAIGASFTGRNSGIAFQAECDGGLVCRFGTTMSTALGIEFYVPCSELVVEVIFSPA